MKIKKWMTNRWSFYNSPFAIFFPSISMGETTQADERKIEIKTLIDEMEAKLLTESMEQRNIRKHLKLKSIFI